MASINPQYSRAELAEQYRAQQAEKEELEASHDAEINNLKKAYSTEKADLEDRFESSIQTEKGAQYDHLRNLKQQLNREDRTFTDTHNHAINQKQTDYRREEIAADQEGRGKVATAIQKYAAAEEYERNRALAAEAEVRDDHRKSAEFIISDSQKRLNALSDEKTKYLEQQKETHAVALDQMLNHYQDARAGTEKQYATEANALQTRADQELNSKRLANASIMAKFDAKQEDPFYQIKRFESDLLDLGESYLLRVKVPAYERTHFKVQVAGQEIQLQGIRSSDEKVDLEPGRSVATRSYQNISERYALGAPVDGKSMVYREEGDWLEYTIPKFGPNHRISDAYRKPPPMKEDLAIGKELNFKNTLPTPDTTRKGGGETMS